MIENSWKWFWMIFIKMEEKSFNEMCLTMKYFFCDEKIVMINFFITMSEILNLCNYFQDRNFSLQTNLFLKGNFFSKWIWFLWWKCYQDDTLFYWENFLLAYGALGGDIYLMISHCQKWYDLTNDLLLLLQTPPNSTSLLQMIGDFILQYYQCIHRHAFIMPLR